MYRALAKTKEKGLNERIFVFPRRVAKPKLRIFCFPYAGGSITSYYSWVKHFNKDIELVFVQPPGRSSRIAERPHESMDELIEELMSQADFITQVPFVFFGHSLGGRVAYELTRQLLASGRKQPEYLIVSGSRAAHLPGLKGNVFSLPKDQFIDRLANMNGTPQEVLDNKELMELLIPVLRADFKIAEIYKADIFPVPVPTLVLYGDEDKDVSIDQVQAWRMLSSKETSIQKLPGGHFFVDSHSDLVIAQVQNVIDGCIRSACN